MASNIRRGKRKFVENSENCESPVKLSPQKISRSSDMSPKSSPIKSPLLDDNGAGSQSFVAKCFYGFKSSAKKDLASPPRKKFEQLKPKKEEWKILRDPSLNQRLLDRIARSPVKQAVLESCSLEEFRKLYRDEIKEVELEAKFANNRLTRSASKIVHRRDDSDEADESEDDCMSFGEEEVFKISNRGFDIDSSSDCSSIKVQSPAPLKDKCIIPERKSLNSEIFIDMDNYDDDLSGNTPGKEFPQQSPSQNRPVSCVTSTSQRKFFKTKSPRDSLVTGGRSVVVGKNFNLRFVPKSQDKKSNSQKRKKAGTTKYKPRKLSLDDSNATSGIVLSNQTNVVKTPVMTSATDRESSLNNENDDLLENLIVKKDSKICISSCQNQKKDEDDVSDISNSLPESEQFISPGRNTKRGSPTESVLSSGNENCENTKENPVTKDKSTGKSPRLFPIFTSEKRSGMRHYGTKTSPKSMKSQMKKAASDSQSQMIIDAGQKKFGATQCNICGMVYCHADPLDEAAHSKFHNRLLEVLKFRGWKKGREVQHFPNDYGVVVMVLPEDPKYCLKKVEEIYELMERDLGFPGAEPFKNPYQKVFFYVSLDKKIEGCCVAERIREGYRVIPGDMDSSSASGRRPWCCDKKAEPALLGISRLWVAASSRRTGVATRLVDSVRQWYDYGSLVPKNALAFSDPTPDGRRFAEKYFGTKAFLVYKFT